MVNCKHLNGSHTVPLASAQMNLSTLRVLNEVRTDFRKDDAEFASGSLIPAQVLGNPQPGSPRFRRLARFNDWNNSGLQTSRLTLPAGDGNPRPFTQLRPDGKIV